MRDVVEVPLVAVFSFSGAEVVLVLRDVVEVPLVAVFSFSGAEGVLVAAYLEGCGGAASCGRVQLQWR